MNKENLVKMLAPTGQEHLAQFWDELSDEEQQVLYNEIAQTDLQEIEAFYQKVHVEMQETTLELDSSMQPVPKNSKGSFSNSTAEQLKNYELEGLRAISEGQVACLLMAGGQGTRLGVNYPKGMYSVKLASDKTLYQIQAERLIRLQHLAGQQFADKKDCSIPWYIMTSEHTQGLTSDFFKENNHFGLKGGDIKLFEQFMLPCLTKEGKIILDQKNKISRAPDGNGGLYKALHKRNILDDMVSRGVKYVHVYGVDNILVKLADPVFIGFCIQKEANCAAKVVKKTEPDEKVGVICKVNERFQVVEYSEISQSTRNLRDENGDLTYNAGSICNHFFSIKFLNDLCKLHEKDLKHHVAEKKIPHIDGATGERVVPKSINGIKLEKFVFDVFPFSTNFAIWEVLREEEFSPLKNADDAKSETPTTCRMDLSALHTKWLVKAGAIISENSSSETGEESPFECEISPLVSYSGEGLENLVKMKTLTKPISMELDPVTKKVVLNSKEILDENSVDFVKLD